MYFSNFTDKACPDLATAAKETETSDSDSSKPTVSWRDVVIRLGYYDILDNTVHMVWLRFFGHFGSPDPYTSYINDSEILTAFLVVLTAALTWVK